MKELVTIGLPFYNNQSTLKLAIKSVYAQTYNNWELIMVDDGSTDNSLAIAKEIKDERVRLISDGKNQGLIFRLNQIASLAKGKYLARMDADDLMDPERIEKQMRLLLQNSDIDLVDTGAYSINENGFPAGKRGLKNINNDPKHILQHAMLLHASVVGKTSWFLNNPYNKEYVRAEDYELWCRTFPYSKFGRIKEPLYIVREGRINVKNYLKSSQTIRKIITKYHTGILSFIEFKKAIYTLRFKEFMYQVFSIVNAHHFLANTRNDALSENEKKRVADLMVSIKDIEYLKQSECKK
ncbi:MAG: glycosyltransferase family 2 protein [Parafilimonas sp.]